MQRRPRLITQARNRGYTGSDNPTYYNMFLSVLVANDRSYLQFVPQGHRNYNPFNGEYTFGVQINNAGVLHNHIQGMTLLFQGMIDYVRAIENLDRAKPTMVIVYDNPQGPGVNTPFRTATLFKHRMTGAQVVAKVEESSQSARQLDFQTMRVDIVYGRRRLGGVYGKLYGSADEFCKSKKAIVYITSGVSNDCFFQCIAYAFVKLRGDAKEIKAMNKQKKRVSEAVKLRQSCRLHKEGEMVSFKDIDYYEDILDISINVVAYTGLKFIRKSKRPRGKQITLLYVQERETHVGHFHYVMEGKEGALWNSGRMCWTCYAPYHDTNGHRCIITCLGCKKTGCPGVGQPLNQFIRRCHRCNKLCYDETCLIMHEGRACRDYHQCDKCNAMYKPEEEHECGMSKCPTCNKLEPIGMHKCFMKPLKEVKDKNLGYVFYDYEIMFDGDNHVVAGIVAIYLHSDEVFQFSTNDEFLDWIFVKDHKDFTFIAHNSGRYDTHFIKKGMIEREMKQTTICNGNTILYCQSTEFGIRFVDSYRFIPMGLRKFSETFNLGALKKTYFPYRFFTVENQHYIGPIPGVEWFEFDSMAPKEKIAGLEWYNSFGGCQIDLYKMCMDYCIEDVRVLKEGCRVFRDMFLEITQNEIDPFQSITIASVCMKIYKRFYLKPDTIALLQEPEDTQDEEKWLASLTFGMLPGYVYIYRKCYDYGCKKCFNPHTRHPLTNEKMYELYYHKHLAEVDQHIAAGKKVEVMWECEWFKKNKAEKPFFNLRDSFAGGHTEPIKMYYDGDQMIRYYDYTSLYPSVQSGITRGVTAATYNTFKSIYYPVGHPEYVYENFEPLANYFGFMKCRVTPPSDLYHPVLGQKANGKFVFDLLPKVGTWTTMELTKAVEMGYTIDEVYAVATFSKKTDDLFAEYVKTFLKIKQQAAGWKKLGCVTEEEKKNYIAEYSKVMGINLEIAGDEYNSGMYFIAKLCLNSLWGKFGQRSSFSVCVDTFNQEDFEKYAHNDKHDVNGIIMHNNIARTISYVVKKEFDRPSKDVNIAIAAFTTAHARLRLYEALEVLGEQVLYMDTDSVIFKGETDLITGPFLGDLTNELSKDKGWITEFVSAGPKSYAYTTSEGENTCKVKGFCLDNIGSKAINFDVMKRMVVGKEKLKPKTQPLQFVIGKDHSIKTHKWEVDDKGEETGKAFRVTFDKREVLEFRDGEIDTIPFGYNK